jgi:hypothetical protein
MARVTALQAVELKIEKAQETVSKTKKAYDTAIANLSNPFFQKAYRSRLHALRGRSNETRKSKRD